MRIWTVFALMAGLCIGSPAFAQKPREEATMAEAKQRFSEGIKLADDGNHEAARLKFGQAWTLLKSPAILFNLARSEQLSGHLVEALEHFHSFAKMASDPKVTEAQVERARAYIAELTNRLGQIEVDAPPAAQIAIDGAQVEWVPQGDPIPVLPGSHEVTATTAGNRTSVTVQAGAGTVVKASLHAPVKPAAAPAPTPVATIEPPREEQRSSWSAGRIAGLAIAGGGVVAVGLGFYFHIDSTNAGNDADDLVKKVGGPSGCNPSALNRTAKDKECSTLADSRDQQDRSQAIRNGLWIGGGALVVGGAALFLLSRKPTGEKPTAWHVLPSVSPQSGGLSVVGAF